jgi:hypothetical protein
MVVYVVVELAPDTGKGTDTLNGQKAKAGKAVSVNLWCGMVPASHVMDGVE